MKYTITALTLLSFSIYYSSSFAQTPDDALRNAWFAPNGTARSMSIGGAIGALGGDISNINGNPAGIAFYKSSEYVITPQMVFNSNTADFRGTNDSKGNSFFGFGPIGGVAGNMVKKGSSWTSKAFGISISRLANFNNHFSYKGFNDYSSYTEQFIEELKHDNASTSAAENDYPLGSSLAYNTYLIDPVLNSSNNPIPGEYTSNVFNTTGLNQNYDAVTKGGYSELSIAFAGNKNDKWYIGGSLNVPITNYKRTLNYFETDVNRNLINGFDSSHYLENFESNGSGINMKLGAIYKPIDNVRVGLAFHTPSFIFFTNETRTEMVTNTENYQGVKMYTSNDITGGVAIKNQYTQITPLRVIASGVWLFGSVENLKQQHGFLSTDIEFVNYRGIRFKGGSDDYGNYLNQVNDQIKSYTRNALNIRFGGELKFDPIAIRAGVAYYQSPYEDKQLEASKWLYNGGIGYRGKGYFIDFAYSYSVNKDVNFPYRLVDKANTFATTTNNKSHIAVTVGLKL